METLHSREIGSLIWGGQYFGEGGALARTASLLEESKQKWMDGAHMKSDYIKALLMYMSTLYSACNHTLRNPRHWFKVIVLHKELMKVSEGFRHEVSNYDILTPEEKDVLVAILMKMYQISFSSHYKVEACGLCESVLRDSDASYSMRMLVRARYFRLLRRGDPDKVRSLAILSSFVRNACKNGLPEGVVWSTVARVAALIGDKHSMWHAAQKDGTPDVIRKYGKRRW